MGFNINMGIIFVVLVIILIIIIKFFLIPTLNESNAKYYNKISKNVKYLFSNYYYNPVNGYYYEKDIKGEYDQIFSDKQVTMIKIEYNRIMEDR